MVWVAKAYHLLKSVLSRCLVQVAGSQAIDALKFVC